MTSAFSLRTTFGAPLVCLTLAWLPEARGAVSYAIPASTYTEDFDGLPKDAPNNATIQTAPVYPNGWTDDSTTVADDRVSLSGWYLYHPLVLAEGGTNGHQRLRFGNGSSNVGSFYAFGSSNTAADMALGDLGSNTLAAVGTDIYVALRLVNNTGITLNSFTLTYDGEQWRDGDSAGPEVLQFDYSTTAVEGDWNSTAAYSAVSGLNFTAPLAGATSTNVDGNTAGRTADITATVTGFSWADGSELWLRWTDESFTGNDDGLAIDNVRFSAIFDPVPEPAGTALLGLSVVALLGGRRRRS